MLFVTLLGCNEKLPDAQSIIDQSIEQAGGDRYTKSRVSFDFRDFHYEIERDGGRFKMTRVHDDSLGTIKDVLTNDDFNRLLNDSITEVPDSMAAKYSASINSVFYFTQLPFGLNDPAVNKKLLGKDTIDEKNYYKIEVWFDQEGGGEDFEDRYLYWISTDSFTVDFLAYEYHTDGGGMRFRKAINPREIKGIRFVDYINFKPKESAEVEFSEIGEAYTKGLLEELSRIENKNIRVAEL